MKAHDHSQVKNIHQVRLWIAPQAVNLEPLIAQQVAACLCANNGCGLCHDCIRLKKDIHPDVIWIRPEGASRSIKIEKIRELQETIHHPPQSGRYQIIVLYEINALNLFSANALLKILEEPPEHTLFLLTSTHDKLPQTLLSRCVKTYIAPPRQEYFFAKQENMEDSARHQLCDYAETCCHILVESLAYRADFIQIETHLLAYELRDVLWFFYGLVSTLIRSYCSSPDAAPPIFKQLAESLAKRYHQPMHLYTILDKINALTATLESRVVLNSALAIDAILLFFFEEENVYLRIN